ncbi:ATP-binding protein [Luteimonas abyssi]|uniref:ATP-binding protein n=1 Tax=Luteimonas abyssi TaxID=1247514 RepID=UPI0009E874F4|nr:ATP-binding protein [Luteimonas abyssi]
MLVGLIGTMSLVMLVAGAFSYRAGLQEAGEMFDAKLAHSARVLVSLVDAPLGDLGTPGGRSAPIVVPVWQGAAHGVGDALAFPTGHAYETKLAFQVRDASGTLVLRSDSGPASPLAPLAPGFSNQVIDGAHWRTFTLRAPTGRWYQSAELSDIRAELAADIAEGTLLPLLLAVPAMALLVWGLVGWSLRGLQRVTAEVEARAADRLAPLQPGGVPREVQGVIGAIDRLLARLDAALQRERRFIADAAHELRTPIAALKVHVDNLRGADDPVDRAASQGQLDIAVARVERLVEQLLQLSRVEPGVHADPPRPVDLHALARTHLDERHALDTTRRLEIELEGGPCVIAGDEPALDALVGNLIDNACRYAPVGGNVRIQVSRDDTHALLVVEDSGPGIPAEARARVFERFHRELGTGAVGSGLGLSIVHQVLERHCGSIALDAAPVLGGLRATVHLPVGTAAITRPESPPTDARAPGRYDGTSRGPGDTMSKPRSPRLRE